MDGVTKVLEEVVMTETKLGEQQEHGNPAVHTKSQHPSFSGTGDIQVLVNLPKKYIASP